MQYKLINKVNPEYSAVEQVLTNRGIPYERIENYLNLDIMNTYNPANLDNIDTAAAVFMNHLRDHSKTLLVADSDSDGQTSAALFLNWCYDYDKTYATDCIDIFLHEGKDHGFENKYISKWKEYKLIVMPDAGSEHYEAHKKLHSAGVDIICLDHHKCKYYSTDAIVVNNQLSQNYPNKAFCGCGVTYKFLKYFEAYYTNTNYVDEYLDLVALGNISDMVSQLSFETCYYIRKGLKQIKNPFFYYMWQKNRFSLGDNLDPIGVAFYITPFINAVCRSGTMEEKQLLFDSMLKFKAFEKLPSTKRGHKMGDEELLVEQACRMCTNVKNRQTRAQDEGQDKLEKMIEGKHLLNNKVLLFLVEPGVVEKNIAGLLANRLMAKYQRPCCILTKNGDYWMGSARGCDKADVRNFKEICEDTCCPSICAGHEGAFGLSLPNDKIDLFIERTNLILKDMPDDAIYYCDYIYNGQDVNPKQIIDMANMKYLYGKDIDEPYIAIKGLKLNKENVILMSPNKNPTLKFVLKNGVCIIKFKASEEEYYEYAADGYVEVDIVGKCQINKWLGNVTPQIIVEQIEVKDRKDYYF